MPIRLGISNLYVDQYLKTGDSDIYRSLTVQADTSIKIAKQFAAGFVDIACIFQSADTVRDMADFIVDENQEVFVWARSKNSVLSPGSPIPIVSCPGGVTDGLMLTSLSKAELPSRIAFNSSDYRANLSAAAVGLGLAVIPSRMLPADLVEAKEYYLPPLMPAKALLYSRPNAHRAIETSEALANLSSIFFAKSKLPKLAA